MAVESGPRPPKSYEGGNSVQLACRSFSEGMAVDLYAGLPEPGLARQQAGRGLRPPKSYEDGALREPQRFG
jgi:hypothetical protein